MSPIELRPFPLPFSTELVNKSIFCIFGKLKSFFDFIRTQGVVGLAVGLVLGGSVSVMVKSLVDNVVMPPLGLIVGSAEGIKGLAWTMGQTAGGQPITLRYGIFLNDLINFVVIALVIYVIVSLLKIDKFDKKKD